MIILFTVRCEIYVHTSHIQGWGADVKRALIYFKVDLLRPSSQSPPLITRASRLTEINTELSFEKNFEVH